MDAGGLAQMAYYNTLNSRNDLGMPTSGFTSRRGSTIKSLSFGQQKLSGIQDNSTPTPRTSRSHLLAGLRTAPKNSGNSVPLTAPPTQLHHNVDPSSIYSNDTMIYNSPRTANFPGQHNQYGGQMCNGQLFTMPEHVLAPPEIQVDDNVCEQIDPNYYAQLVATNRYLAEQQQRLQQQLINVQVAAQQFQGMNLGLQQYTTPPITPQSLYQQHLKNNTQVSASPNRANISTLPYNSLAGQSAYFKSNQQSGQYDTSQLAYQLSNCLPAQRVTASSRARTSMLPYESTTISRGASPPIKPQSPVYDHSSLPPSSASLFRRGHRKAPSSLTIGSEESSVFDGPKNSFSSKPIGTSSSSLASFGPGQGRAGEHPVRQPRGPPSIEILLAKPTTKSEGSRNFASRARQSEISSIVHTGIERHRTPGRADSGSLSPASEVGEIAFAATDNDSDSGKSGSGSLTSRPALGSPRTTIHGAIGSNRPSSRQNRRFLERKSIVSLDSSYTSASVSGDEGISLGENFAAVIKNGKSLADVGGTNKNAPKLILTPADKRKVLM
ncbi:putative transcription initiation factor iif subunit alpha [Golovinomyces cichoracearum]|uniref:Putative transcription initiation factor iif subunit alpha n=1 Tax=Golovinomyces cichoracearum TaxID=62708 RepID=A0A420IFI3_9PEZI|nr:putative transcription initiation factor iif subunit alpha [Golovinomyces cichoracearum]